MTLVRDVLADARRAMVAAGVADPRREALTLWAAASGAPLAAPLLEHDGAASPEAVQRMDALVVRRLAGEPLAYVTGVAGFRHLTLASDPRALIPRPETEGLVEVALAVVTRGVAADIGTGTGAIALSLRQEGAFDEVLAVDISPEALALAAENGARTGLVVRWLLGDLVEPLHGRSVDLLVSNPPYLTEGEYEECDPSVRDHEPRLALPSGHDGLTATRRLLDQGRGVMRLGGWIALEVDCTRAAEVAALAASFGWVSVEILDDLFGRARYVRAQWRGTDDR